MTAAITTRHGAPRQKPFTWSYSRIKNFEACPKRHYHIDILPKGHPDKVVEPEGDALQWGKAVHTCIDQYITRGTILPPVQEKRLNLKAQVDRVFLTKSGKDVREHGAIVQVEQKYAIREDFGATGWYDDDVWFRGIGDVIWILGIFAYIGDWKTGKILDDSKQLALMAQCVFSHYPQVQRVKSEFVWLKEEATTTAVLNRSSMAGIWAEMYPRVNAAKQAYLTTSYPANPGGLCRNYCPVKQCPHNGR